MANDNYISQDRVRVEVSTPVGTPGLPGPWMQASGFDGERDVTSQRPGVGQPEVQLRSRQKLGDVTLVKMFNAATDHATVRLLQSGYAFPDSVISSVDVDEDDHVIPGTDNTSYGCSVKSWALSDVDVNGADARTLSVTMSRTRAA